MSEEERAKSTPSVPISVGRGPAVEIAAELFLRIMDFALREEDGISLLGSPPEEISGWMSEMFAKDIEFERHNVAERNKEAVQREGMRESLAILIDPNQEQEVQLQHLFAALPPDAMQQMVESLQKGDTAALNTYVWGQPIQQIPGRRLRGTVVTQSVDDWRFVNSVGLCEIEVDPEAPRSYTVGCYGTQQSLYASHDLIPNARKSWAEFMAENPNARVKFGDNIYPVKGTRIFDQAERQKIAHDRRTASPRRGPSLMNRVLRIFQTPAPAPAATGGRGPAPVPDSLWMYRLESRQS